MQARVHTLAGTFALLFLLLLSFSPPSSLAVNPAGLKIIHALPPPMLDFSYMFVDVLVDGALFFSRVEYLMGSSNGSHPYRLLSAPATYTVSFRYSNHQELGIIATTQLHVQPSTYHTVVIFGLNTTAFPTQTVHLVDQANATGKALADGGKQQRMAIGKGTASIRYFNAGVSFSATTVKVNGKDLFISTPYGQAWNGGGYVEIDASTAKDGVFDFEVVDARYEEIQITFDRLQLTNGCAFTLFAAGVLGNYYSPLMIVDTRDMCSARARLVAPPFS
jgi:hypothetical protein